MTYRHVSEREDYSDYSSGKVFYSLAGHPAFPVRLTLEVFRRCLELRNATGAYGPVRLYDPCCGEAHHLCVLAFFHWDDVMEIAAADVDAEAVAVARRNLSLLTPEGLDRRIREVKAMMARFGKVSHTAALQSAERLRSKLIMHHTRRPMQVSVPQADALQQTVDQTAPCAQKFDLVITDVPYGVRSHWMTDSVTLGGQVEPTSLLLGNLRPKLAGGAVVAVATAKQQRVAHAAYRQVGRLKVGRRQVTVLQLTADVPPHTETVGPARG